MAATVRAVTTGAHDTGTVTVALPAGTVAGDLLVAICFRDESYGTGAWTGNPFQLLGELATGTSPTTGGRVQVWTRTATGSDSSTFSYTNSLANCTGTVTLFAIAGAGTPTMATQNNTGSSTSMQAPSIPSPGLDPLLLCAWSARSEGTARTITVPGSMTAVAQINPSGNYIVTRAAYESLTGTGATGTRTATVSAAETSLAVAVAVPAAVLQVSSSDAAGSSDAFTAAAALTSADSASASDTAAVAAALPAVADSAAAVDAFAVEEITAKSFTDSATTSDTAALAAAVTSADAGSGSDAFTADRTSTVADSASTSDAFVPGLRVDDVATTSDAFSLIVIPDASAIRSAVARVPVYELLCVARIPAPAGPPTLVVVDEIPWRSLRYSDTLSQPQGLTAQCPEESLSREVVHRLRGQERYATELRLLRDGKVVFAGPVRTWNRRDDGAAELVADGLLAYLQRMIVLSDQTFTQVDQFSMVKQWVDHWQTGLPHGHYGIDTANVGTSGRLRDGTYKMTEIHKVLQRSQELGARADGFDLEVDPETRALQLWYPQKGTDRSTGADAIIFDDLTTTSPNVSCSVAPDDFASHAYGVGTSSGSDTPISAFYFNPQVAAAIGAGVVTGSWSDVSEQTTLDDHTLALLRKSGKPLVVPGPQVRVTDAVDLGSYAEGDTVAFEMAEDRLGFTGAFRLRRRTVNVSESGAESADLEVV